MTASPNPSRGLLSQLLGIVVVPILLLDAAVRPLFAPLIRAVARLSILASIAAWIGRLPPYAILCVLAVPFITAEPLKIVALYWMGTGHPLRGAVTLLLAYGVSFILVERIFDAGREKLMRIAWLSRVIIWVSGLRDACLNWLRATAAWRMAQAIAAAARAWIGGLLRVAKARP